MTDYFNDVRDSIETDFCNLRMHNQPGEYRYAGFGRSEYFSSGLEDGGRTSIARGSNYLLEDVSSGFYIGDGESDSFGNSTVVVKGDFTSKAVFKNNVVVLPRDRLIRAVAKGYSQVAKFRNRGEKEFWTNMLLHYLKRGTFDFKSSWWLERKVDFSDEKEEESYRRATEAAKTLKAVMGYADDYRSVVVLSQLDPYTIAVPDGIEIEGRYSFVAHSSSGFRNDVVVENAQGRLLLRPENPAKYCSIKIPCVVETDSIEMPNRENDIVRTDGLRKKGHGKRATLLREGKSQVLIEDVGRAYTGVNIIDVRDGLCRASRYTTKGVLCGGGILGVVGGMLGAVYYGLKDLSDGTIDAGFGYGLGETVKDWAIIGALIGAGLGGSIVASILKGDRIPYERKIFGNPSMSYCIKGESA